MHKREAFATYFTCIGLVQVLHVLMSLTPTWGPIKVLILDMGINKYMKSEENLRKRQIAVATMMMKLSLKISMRF